MAQEPNRDATDAEIIELSWTEPEVFGVIFERHYDKIYRYLVRRTGRAAGPELASDTFVAAFAQRRRYLLGYPSATPWLFGIATNLVRGHTRRVAARRGEARLVPVDTGEFVEDVAWRTDAEVVVRESGLIGAINELRDDERDVLFLFAFGDLHYTEIADYLGIPIGTVRSRLSRLRSKLYPALLEALGEREPE